MLRASLRAGITTETSGAGDADVGRDVVEASASATSGRAR